MKLFKKILSSALSFGVICSSAFSACVFAGGENGSGLFAFGSGTFGSGAPLFKDKQEDIMFGEPFKWGETEILGIACNWDKTDFLAESKMRESVATSKLIRGIFTNNLSLIKQGVEEGTRITQPIDVITSDPTHRGRFIFVTDLKQYMSAEIVDYLRKAFNERKLAECRASRHHGYGFGQTRVYGPGQHSDVHTIFLFDGETPLKIEADEIDRIAEPIDFLDTKIIGFIKDWSSAYRPLDKDMYEKLVRGILTGNLDMIKSAVESGKVEISTFPVVTSDGRQIDFEPLVEARYCANKGIMDCLRKANDKWWSKRFGGSLVSSSASVKSTLFG